MRSRPRFSFGFIDAAVGFDLPDEADFLRADQPVPGRHGGAVIEQRSVLEHDRISRVITNDDLVVATRFPAEQLADPLSVFVHVG